MAVDKPNSPSRLFALSLFMLAVLVVITSYFFVLLMGYGFMFFTVEGVDLSMRATRFPVLLFLFLIGFETPPIEIGVVFAFLLLIYVLCFAAAFQWRESFSSVLRKSFSRPFRRFFDNFLLTMPLISSMVLVAVLIIIYSQEAVGIPTGQVAFPPNASSQEIFLELAYAPVVEELGFRLAPIGLYTVLYVFVAGRNTAAKGMKLLAASVFYPDKAKKIAGLRNINEHGFWRGISKAEWVMVVVTSLVFGLAHVISGIGWEPGKITSVFVQGSTFAVAYLAYGFEAPILLHWFFNYYSFFFDPGILSTFFPGAEPVLSITELLILGLGAVGWSLFAVFVWRRFLKRKSSPMRQEVPAPPPLSPESTPSS